MFRFAFLFIVALANLALGLAAARVLWPKTGERDARTR